MLYLLDANIPYSAKELFSKPHEVLHVQDLNLQQEEDTVIIAWAKKNKAALISRDFDFANILNFPPKEYFGIIILKIPPFYAAEDIKRVLKNFLSNVDLASIPKSTIIVEETRWRTRT